MHGDAVVLPERRLVSVKGFFTFDCGSGDNSQRESFDGNGGAWVLLEHRQFAVRDPRRHRPRLGLRPLDGDLRRVRRHGVAAGASTLSSLQAATGSAWSRAAADSLFVWVFGKCCIFDLHSTGSFPLAGSCASQRRSAPVRRDKSSWERGGASSLVDLAFGAHLGHSLFKDRMRDLVCLDRRCLWVSKFRKELFDMFSTASVVLHVDST